MADTLTYSRHGDEWRFSDGTVLPVVSGADGEEVPPAGEPAAAETPAPVETATPPAAENDAPWTDPVVAERMITDLRKENAGYRTRAKAFEGLDDGARDAVVEFIDAYRADPSSTATTALVQWAKDLTAAERGAVAEAAGVADDNAPITRAEFTQMMKEAEEQRNLSAATADLQREAAGLGYEAESPEYVLLLKFAHEQTGGDLTAADAKVKALFQAKIDEFVNGKKSSAQKSPVLSQAGTLASEEQPRPTDWNEIRKGAAEFLAARNAFT